MNINGKTKLCCIIGNPVEHSLSPQMHNAAFRKLGLNYVYVAFRVEKLKGAIEGLKALEVRGIVVTVPHKIEVMNYVDEIDETARQIGAVNTIVNENGMFKATNTDWVGAIGALEEVTELKGKKVAVLGAGGAARSVIYGLKKREAVISVFNRTLEKAQNLDKNFHLEGAFSLHDNTEIKKADIIINTTSVGLEPRDDKSPLSDNTLDKRHIVFDIVYTPRETKLLQQARKAGARCVYGDKMVLYGGVQQFELFTHNKAPVKIMEHALQKAMNH